MPARHHGRARKRPAEQWCTVATEAGRSRAGYRRVWAPAAAHWRKLHGLIRVCAYTEGGGGIAYSAGQQVESWENSLYRQYSIMTYSIHFMFLLFSLLTAAAADGGGGCVCALQPTAPYQKIISQRSALPGSPASAARDLVYAAKTAPLVMRREKKGPAAIEPLLSAQF